MNKERLSAPRFVVLIATPYLPFKVGDILEKHLYASGKWHIPGHTFDPEDYPLIFRRLEWWEVRKVEELPQYVKITHKDCARRAGLFGKVYKWHEYTGDFPSIAGDYGAEIDGYKPEYLTESPYMSFNGQRYGRINAAHLEPATREEYALYIKSKN